MFFGLAHSTCKDIFVLNAFTLFNESRFNSDAQLGLYRKFTRLTKGSNNSVK